MTDVVQAIWSPQCQSVRWREERAWEPAHCRTGLTCHERRRRKPSSASVEAAKSHLSQCLRVRTCGRSMSEHLSARAGAALRVVGCGWLRAGASPFAKHSLRHCRRQLFDNLHVPADDDISVVGLDPFPAIDVFFVRADLSLPSSSLRDGNKNSPLTRAQTCFAFCRCSCCNSLRTDAAPPAHSQGYASSGRTSAIFRTTGATGARRAGSDGKVEKLQSASVRPRVCARAASFRSMVHGRRAERSINSRSCPLSCAHALTVNVFTAAILVSACHHPADHLAYEESLYCKQQAFHVKP